MQQANCIMTGIYILTGYTSRRNNKNALSSIHVQELQYWNLPTVYLSVRLKCPPTESIAVTTKADTTPPPPALQTHVSCPHLARALVKPSPPCSPKCHQKHVSTAPKRLHDLIVNLRHSRNTMITFKEAYAK